jgi:hypothetical protein
MLSAVFSEPANWVAKAKTPEPVAVSEPKKPNPPKNNRQISQRSSFQPSRANRSEHDTRIRQYEATFQGLIREEFLKQLHRAQGFGVELDSLIARWQMGQIGFDVLLMMMFLIVIQDLDLGLERTSKDAHDIALKMRYLIPDAKFPAYDFYREEYLLTYYGLRNFVEIRERTVQNFQQLFRVMAESQKRIIEGLIPREPSYYT